MDREQRSTVLVGDWPALASRYWRHLGGVAGSLLRLTFLALVLLAIGLHVPVASSPLAIGFGVLGLVLAATAALPLAVYATIWAAFTVLRAVADDAGFPDRGQLIASVDRRLGNGVMPSEWLQRWFHDSALGGMIDVVAIGVHLSYFAVPHLVAVGFWWLAFTGRSDRFFRFYVTGLTAVMALGLLAFVLFPTAPPWLEAARTGESSGIERIAGSSEPSDASSGEIYVVRDPNKVAAFPSLHQAITLVAAGALWWYDRRLGMLGIAYSLAMGFALVYLGEHYLVDVIAGWLLGAGVIALLDQKQPCRDRQR